MNIPDKTTEDSYTGAEFTEFKNELQNFITSANITLASNSIQVMETVKRYVLSGDYYIDTGAANNYVLTTISPYAPASAYTNGMRVRCKANATNTGVSTINIDGLGIKTIKKDFWTNDLDAGDIVVGQLYEFVYDTSSGFFDLVTITQSFANIVFLDTNVVNNQAIPVTWTNIDLSSVVGANSTLVMCRISALGGPADIKFRTDGDTPDVASTALPNLWGGGTTATTMDVDHISYIWIKTSSTGIIEVEKGASGTNYSLDVIAYIK
jgi:hypothetical protein